MNLATRSVALFFLLVGESSRANEAENFVNAA